MTVQVRIIEMALQVEEPGCPCQYRLGVLLTFVGYNITFKMFWNTNFYDTFVECKQMENYLLCCLFLQKSVEDSET